MLVSSLKLAALTFAIMVGLMFAVVIVVSIVTRDWMPLISFGIGIGICVVVGTVQISLMMYLDKKWGKK